LQSIDLSKSTSQLSLLDQHITEIQKHRLLDTKAKHYQSAIQLRPHVVQAYGVEDATGTS
jgi:hypothetical protein